MKQSILPLAISALAFAMPMMSAQAATAHLHAHVSMAHARTIALRARAGRVVAQELEREGGGTGLRYSFDIRSHGKLYEVGVDANTGAVLENAPEGPHPD